jgi:hypothetical protein
MASHPRRQNSSYPHLWVSNPTQSQHCFISTSMYTHSAVITNLSKLETCCFHFQGKILWRIYAMQEV